MSSLEVIVLIGAILLLWKLNSIHHSLELCSTHLQKLREELCTEYSPGGSGAVSKWGIKQKLDEVKSAVEDLR